MTSSEKKIIYNGENEVFEKFIVKNKQTEKQANRTRKEEKESANEAETDYRHSLVAEINAHR